MKIRSICWLSALLVVLAACKTSEAQDAPLPSEALAPKPAPVEVAEAPQEMVTGYDLNGAVECLPLAKDRACIQRQDRLAIACQQAGGESLVCEDCALVCSKPVSSQ